MIIRLRVTTLLRACLQQCMLGVALYKRVVGIVPNHNQRQSAIAQCGHTNLFTRLAYTILISRSV